MIYLPIRVSDSESTRLRETRMCRGSHELGRFIAAKLTHLREMTYSGYMEDRELLRHVERSAGKKAGYKQLVRELGLGGGRQRRELLEQLDRLTTLNYLVKVDREHWAIKAAVQAAETK